MGWKLEAVDERTGKKTVVFELGTIKAPAHCGQVGLGRSESQDILRSLQSWVVRRQEEAIRSKAKVLRESDPDLRLKDYRKRSVHTLYGKVSLRVPRLSSTSSTAPPELLAKSGGSGTDYDHLRAKLGAWMSYRAADSFLREMFPHASGAGRSTIQRRQRKRQRSRAQNHRTTLSMLRRAVDYRRHLCTRTTSQSAA